MAAACSTTTVHEPPSLVAVIADASPAVVAIGDDKTIFGSGFRLAGTQFVATAAHVVMPLKGAPEVKWREQHWTAQVVAVDESADVAVIEMQGDVPMPGLTLSPPRAPLAPGEWIVVLGCPFGSTATATTGIVSGTPGAILEPVSLRTRIQLNAAVNPGNSGGPVLNMRREVVGIANAMIPGGFGLGFAVPADAIRALIEKAGRKQ